MSILSTVTKWKLAKIGINPSLILRIIQGIFALVVLALSSYIIHWYNTTTAVSPPAELIFILVTAVWSLLSLLGIQLLPHLFPRAQKAHTTLPLALSNTLLWLSSFATLTTFLSRLLFCHGLPCHAAYADAAFAGVLAALWAVSVALTGVEVARVRRGERRKGEGKGKGKGFVRMDGEMAAGMGMGMKGVGNV